MIYRNGPLALFCAASMALFGTEATYAKEPIAITAQAVKQSVNPGERIVIRVLLTNNGKEAISYYEGGGIGYTIQVKGPTGEDVSMHRKGFRKDSVPVSVPMKNLRYELLPGQTDTKRLVWEPEAGYDMKGEYGFRVCRWDEEVRDNICSNDVVVKVSK
jgi:hypothetical protein